MARRGVVVGRRGVVVGHCGVVVGRCGVVVGSLCGRCGSFHVLVTTMYVSYTVMCVFVYVYPQRVNAL